MQISYPAAISLPDFDPGPGQRLPARENFQNSRHQFLCNELGGST